MADGRWQMADGKWQMEFPQLFWWRLLGLSRKGLMTVMLQKKSTLEYVKNQTEWTALRGEARVFASGMEALYFCYNHGIRNMKIVGEFDGGMSFNVPVTDRRVS